MSTRWVAIGLVCVAASCGDDAMMPPIPPPPSRLATVEPRVAFEGHRGLVVSLSADGVDLSSARVEAEDPAGPLVVDSYECAAQRCAAVVTVLDQRANSGQPIPSPIDGNNAFLIVEVDGDPYRALLNVFPLDSIVHSGGTELEARGIRLASSLDAAAGSVFAGGEGEPVRWFVFGGGTVAGTFDVSADGAQPRSGGHAGGTAGADGDGPSAGLGHGAAGGGGGNASAGSSGVDIGGGAGGAGGAVSSPDCVLDLSVAPCGGSGAGGGAGGGGAGGGSVAIVSLGTLDLSGATLRSNGGDGMDGGGGGAGGHILVAAPGWSAPTLLEADGGAGAAGGSGAMGGEGGQGFVRVDLGGGEAPPDTMSGPVVDLAGIEPWTSDPTVTLSGRASPSAAVEVSSVGGSVVGSTVATADGTYTVSVDLSAGLNRLSITAMGSEGPQRSWIGTNFELANVVGQASPVPVGGTVDIVRLN